MPASVYGVMWFLVVMALSTGQVQTAGLKKEALQSFWNERCIPLLVDQQIPGVVVSLVASNRVIMQEAYGWADLEEEIPVIASETLFRVASISKIFTAMAVLQLVDEDRLDLSNAIEPHLDSMRLEIDWEKPVTMHHLLTHSSGFDVNRFHYAARTKEDLISLEDYLVQSQPHLLYPPGHFLNYDNYGYTLAGYIVQEISGVPYAEYIRKRILGPWNMRESRMGLFSVDPTQVASGYLIEGDSVEASQLDFINIRPAAGLLVTCRDMTRFMLRLLAEPNGTNSIPVSETVLHGLMESQQEFHSLVPGRSYGFNQVLVQGRRMLRQTGKWPGFNSILLIDPKNNVGLFLAYNLDDDLHMAKVLGRMFAKQWLNGSVERPHVTSPSTDLQSGTRVEGLEGYYVSLRHPVHSPWLGRPEGMRIERSNAREWLVNDSLFHRLGKDGLQAVLPPRLKDGFPGERIGWIRDSSGDISHIITQSATYRKASWYETPQLRVIVPGLMLFIMVSSLLFWLLRAMMAGLRGLRSGMSGTAKSQGHPPDPFYFKFVALCIALLTGSLIVWFHIMLTIELVRLDDYAHFYGMPETIERLLGWTPYIFVLTLLLTLAAILSWLGKVWQWPFRMHYTLFVLTAIFYCLGLHTRNYLLLSFL